MRVDQQKEDALEKGRSRFFNPSSFLAMDAQVSYLSKAHTQPTRTLV